MRIINSNLKRKHVFILFFAIALLPVSSVLAEFSVSLSAKVIAPGQRQFTGRGYLNTADQRFLGNAQLIIPHSNTGQMKLEIMKGFKVSAIWSWEIDAHTYSEKTYRQYDYTRDEYLCHDSEGRVLKIVIHSYIRSNNQKVFAVAYGADAFFTGQEKQIN